MDRHIEMATVPTGWMDRDSNQKGCPLSIFHGPSCLRVYLMPDSRAHTPAPTLHARLPSLYHTMAVAPSRPHFLAIL